MNSDFFRCFDKYMELEKYDGPIYSKDKDKLTDYAHVLVNYVGKYDETYAGMV